MSATSGGMDDRSRAFRRRFFPEASASDWRDWRWQLKHRLRDRETLARVFALTSDEEDTLRRLGNRIPVSLTPYYASRLFPDPAGHPLRPTVIPQSAEFTVSPGE